jgi:GH24 family phage-related lysozyme (muramidase)
MAEALETRRWLSPIIVAILAAAVAGLGNAGVALLNAKSQADLEKQRAEQERILEVIKTGNTEAAATNLRFLLNAGLIADANTRTKLTTYLNARKPGGGPSLPSDTNAAEFVSAFENTGLRPYRDPVGNLVIGTHVLTDAEKRTGMIVIDGKRVSYKRGITHQQANALLAQELAPLRRKIDDVVTVPLSAHQLDALTSLVYNVGFGVLRKDGRLLTELNAGHYDAVPEVMMRFTKAGGRTLPSLVRRRQSEVELWNSGSK